MNEIIYSLEPLAPQQEVDLESWLSGVQSCGFDGVEAPLHPNVVGFRGVTDLAALKSRLIEHHLQAPVVSVPWPFPGQTDAPRADAVAHTAEQLSLMLGSRTLVVSPPAGSQSEELQNRLVGELIRLQNHADPMGIAVAVELAEGGILGGLSGGLDWLYLHSPQTGAAAYLGDLLREGVDMASVVGSLTGRLSLLYLSASDLSRPHEVGALFSALKGTGFKGPLALKGGSSADCGTAAHQVRDLWGGTMPGKVAVVEQ